ncbi:outer dense fiber protein 1 [Cricetulus griseus]|nr:outer dense fiber protein 1 [Cricetulus griseus]
MREQKGLRRTTNRILASSCSSSNILGSVNVFGLEPDQVKVPVKDGKVCVSAERENRYDCLGSKKYSYRNICKESSLQPCVDEKEVNHSYSSAAVSRSNLHATLALLPDTPASPGAPAAPEAPVDPAGPATPAAPTALRTLGTLRALGTLWNLRPLQPLRNLQPLWTLRTLRPLLSLLSLWQPILL